MIKALLILFVVCYVISQVESQDRGKLLEKIRRLTESVERLQADVTELSDNNDCIEAEIAELGEKMNDKDDSIDSIKAEVAELGQKMTNKDDSIEAKVADLGQKMDDKDNSIETSITEIKEDVKSVQEQAVKEALCGYRRNVDNNDQIITFDKVYVERNDNGGLLNKESGIFTAGRAGVYAVSLSAFVGESKFSSRLYIRLRTSSGSYQVDDEDNWLQSYTYFSEASDFASLSASRYMHLRENEELYLEYYCTEKKHCLMNGVKFCISYYSTSNETNEN